MQGDTLLIEAEYWQLQAEKMRTIAHRMKDPGSKQAALNIAADYEQQADDMKREARDLASGSGST